MPHRERDSVTPKWRTRRGPRPAGSRRRWRWLIAGLAAVLAAAVVTIAMVFPAVAATACPGCYGLQRVQSDLYVEQGLSAERRQHVTEVVQAAEQRVGDFFGGRESRPRVLACLTQDCYGRIGGGGERGKAILDRALLLSPLGVNVVIVSHELTHAELRARLRSRAGQVPRWFNEGLAVLVSEDPRYLPPETAADRCLASLDAGQPLAGERSPASTAGEDFYRQAACRVSRWVDANGGRQAVLDLIRHLAAGEEFTAIVPG
jgi:hypothetical protein